MTFFATKNLIDSSVTPCLPWEFGGLSLVPPLALTDKAERERWLQNPTTEYQCYSTFEGVNNQLRVTGARSNEEGNVPVFMHGFAADYDIAVSDAEIDAAIARMGNLKPNWIERTLSGNCRLVWNFVRPIPLVSIDFCLFLLKRIDTFLPLKQLGGLDQGAQTAPERLFTNGGQWRNVHDAPIPWVLLFGFALDTLKKFAWKSANLGAVIPLDVAAKELAAKFPRFSTWPGDFTLGAQGPSFWVDGSTSAKSAFVTPFGLSTFAAHAHKPFATWSELIGHEFVSQYKLTEMGKAVDGVYFDGTKFIRQNTGSGWLHETRDDFSQFLRTERGLSDRREKGETFSPIDSAVMHVKNSNHIEGAGSYAFYPKGLIVANGKRFLNTHNRDVLQPSIDLTPWGPGGKFPWISYFLEGFFSSADQLPYFMSWAAYFYRGCYLRSPSPGQNTVIVGDTGLGKTFLMRKLMGTLFSGFTEAKEWLMGQTGFNSDLFDTGLWCVDDATLAQGPRGHQLFCEMLKRMTANDTFWSNEKYRKATMVYWTGRIMLSCNLDVESRRLIPDTDLSNREKLNLFLVNAKREDGFKFPDTRVETNAIVTRELPYFAKFLLEFRTPEHCRPEDTRFGVAHYHEESLATTSNHGSVSGTFGEILDEHCREYFTTLHPNADSFTGTALQIHKAIHGDPTLIEAMRPFSVQTVGRMLCLLGEKGVFKIAIHGDEYRRVFEIFRDARFPKKPVATPPPMLENSAFQKPTP